MPATRPKWLDAGLLVAHFGVKLVLDGLRTRHAHELPISRRAGPDSIDGMGSLRHGGWAIVQPGGRAVDAGVVLAVVSFGHVRQLDAVASRFLAGLVAATPLLDDVGAR